MTTPYSLQLASPLTWQKGLCRCDNVKSLEVGRRSWMTPQTQCPLKDLRRGGRRDRCRKVGVTMKTVSGRRSSEDEGATLSPGIQAAPGSWKRDGNGFFPERSPANSFFSLSYVFSCIYFCGDLTGRVHWRCAQRGFVSASRCDGCCRIS